MCICCRYFYCLYCCCRCCCGCCSRFCCYYIWCNATVFLFNSNVNLHYLVLFFFFSSFCSFHFGLYCSTTLTQCTFCTFNKDLTVWNCFSANCLTGCVSFLYFVARARVSTSTFHIQLHCIRLHTSFALLKVIYTFRMRSKWLFHRVLCVFFFHCSFSSFILFTRWKQKKKNENSNDEKEIEAYNSSESNCMLWMSKGVCLSA